jgi:CHAT domain-containing protein
MLIRRGSVKVAASAKPRSAIRPLVAAVRGSIDGALATGSGRLPPFDFAASHALYGVLFPAEIRAGASGMKKLHVAATDALASLPFAALVSRPVRGTGDAALRDARWLIRDLSLDVAVSMASVGKGGTPISRTTVFAGIGAPALSGDPGKPIQLAGLFRSGRADVRAISSLPPLPKALAELAEMRAALGGTNSTLVTGAEASEARIKTMDLSPYSIIAFATHGLIANQVDGLEEPALVLTPPSELRDNEDGLLTVSEIAALRLNADWVILSACNTAAGSTQSAPSYTGLAHAFLYAGARSLLLSHWQVRDDAASRLSVATVRGTASGLDRAEALRRAMLALIADRKVPGGAHPAVWAPFVLIGG